MSSESDKPIFVVVSRLPAPYREPLFQRVHECGRVKLFVLYQFRAREGTAWGKTPTGFEGAYTYSNECLADSPDGFLREMAVFFKVLRSLPGRRADLILIHGYSYSASWAAMLICWFLRTPCSLRGDSNGYLEEEKATRGGFRRFFLRRLVKKASAIFVIGKANKYYWELYGARAAQFVEARYAVDETLFTPDPVVEREDDTLRFLFVGRLIVRKRVLLLADAFIRFIKETGCTDCELSIVGAGKDFDELEKKVKKWGGTQIKLRGRCAPSELPAIYREHDVLICSYEKEPWGLTINEAMSCGLAIIGANNGTVGATVDLLDDGVNGIGLKSIDEESLLEGLKKIWAEKGRVGEMKAASLRIIKEWRYDSAVSGFCSATERAHRG